MIHKVLYGPEWTRETVLTGRGQSGGRFRRRGTSRRESFLRTNVVSIVIIFLLSCKSTSYGSKFI